MNAIIKKYTWWTLYKYTKNKEEQVYYQLVAISPNVQVSGVKNSLNDSFKLNLVSKEGAKERMNHGAIIFGLRRGAAFKQSFKFNGLETDITQVYLNAEMYGIFTLNSENNDTAAAALSAFLIDLSATDSKKNEWSAEDLQSLLTEGMKVQLRAALHSYVSKENVNKHTLLSEGDSQVCREEFPKWLAVKYLHTKFTHSETQDESGSQQQEEYKRWEEEYNSKVEEFERKKAENVLKIAQETANLDNLNSEYVLKLAKIEAQRNFFRHLHPWLADINKSFETASKEIISIYGRWIFYCLTHPLHSWVIGLTALLIAYYLTNTFVPLRVQLKIEGQNDSAAAKVEEIAHNFISQYNESVIFLKQEHLQFSDLEDGGMITNEFVLVKKYITDFEKVIKDFARNNQSFVIGKLRCQEEGYALGSGGLKFPLKKKSYVITVKNVPIEKQKIILLTKNFGIDLETFLQNECAEGGVVTRESQDDKIIFIFQRRSGLTIKKLKEAIIKNLKESKGETVVINLTGDNPLIVDARLTGFDRICLIVAQLSKEEKKMVGEKFGIDIRSQNVIEVYGDRKENSDKLTELENAGIPGRWVNDNTYEFIPKSNQLKVVIQGTPNDVTSNCLRNSGFTTNGNGNYSCEYYTTKEKEEKLAALNALAPALSLHGQDDNGIYIYTQRQHVKWSAPGLPEVVNALKGIMGGRTEGYFSEDEIGTVLEKLKGYSHTRNLDANGLSITISKPQNLYQIIFFLRNSDDYEKICFSLKQLCGQELQPSTPGGNPKYFTFRVTSYLDSKTLKEELYEATHAICNSVASKDIVVKEGMK